MPAPLDKTTALKDGPENFIWYDASALTMAGKGWPRESRQYERFPTRAEGRIPAAPWNQSLACAGLSYVFSSDADFLMARWIDYNGDPAVAEARVNCPDLYVRHENRWQWLGVARPYEEGTPVHKLTGARIPPAMRDYKLYLPLGRGMRQLEIGIRDECILIPGELPQARPIVFYGTSINQGASASRPGNNHISMIERDLDYPVINLGLSGSACMEPEVVALVTEQDAAVFVIDCLPNMQEQIIRERFMPGIRHIREKHPETPIVVVDSITYQDGFLVTERYSRYTLSNCTQREGFDALAAEGMTGLQYVGGDDLLGHDNDGTVDGTHPNDLGFRRMADVLGPVLRPLVRA